MLRLEQLLDRHPRDLSGGQRQRVAIGRAIVREPDVFLFDEPLSNLDAALRVSTRVEIAKLHRLLGATMVYVTHDQIEAMTLADRIVVMNQGRIEQVGKPLDLYYAPANLFVAGFIGSPAMNFFPAQVETVERRNRARRRRRIRAARPACRRARSRRATHDRRAARASEDRRTTGRSPTRAWSSWSNGWAKSSFAHVRRADDKMLVVEVRGRETPAVTETVAFRAPLQDIHVFDASGRRVDTEAETAEAMA